MKSLISLSVFLCIFAVSSSARYPDKAPDWESFQFLIGEWVGDGTGVPGQGVGGFTFNFDLEGRILVRRNRADYPATKERPGFSHSDLMVIYQNSEDKQVRSTYYDNEGHVIQYAVSFLDDGKMLRFISEAQPSSPRFRLTYIKNGNDTLTIQFDIAPAGKPDAFQRYISATAHRKSAH